MFMSRFATRSSRVALTQFRNSLLVFARQKQPEVPIVYNQYHSLLHPKSKVGGGQVSMLNHLDGIVVQRFGMSSSASPKPTEKDTTQPGNELDSVPENAATVNAETEVSEQTEASVPGDAKVHVKKDTSDSDIENDLTSELTMDDLSKLLLEKEALLESKQEELKKLQDKALRTYAEMQNSMDRTKREAENLKKFAIQDFAKSLLDVADNMGRASSAVKEKYLNINPAEDNVGAVPLMKTLLEGVEMTEKQLAEAFKKCGLQKYDPVNEEFDPHRHNAVFQVLDGSKPPGTVAVVLKAGYTLHDRVIRPAEVGVTKEVENNEAN